MNEKQYRFNVNMATNRRVERIDPTKLDFAHLT